jgi:hypothetical protein
MIKKNDFYAHITLTLKGKGQKIINPRQNLVGLAFRVKFDDFSCVDFIAE